MSKKIRKKDLIQSASWGFKQAQKYYKELLEGEILSIDPSSGSRSSMPGYALFSKGELVENGTIEVPLGDKIYERLAYLAKSIKEEFNTKPDILVIEDIPVGRGRMRLAALRSLNMSVGAVVGALEVDKIVALHPKFWKSHTDTTYLKSDADDAKAIGEVAIKIAKETLLYESQADK